MERLLKAVKTHRKGKTVLIVINLKSNKLIPDSKEIYFINAKEENEILLSESDCWANDLKQGGKAAEKLYYKVIPAMRDIIKKNI